MKRSYAGLLLVLFMLILGMIFGRAFGPLIPLPNELFVKNYYYKERSFRIGFPVVLPTEHCDQRKYNCAAV